MSSFYAGERCVDATAVVAPTSTTKVLPTANTCTSGSGGATSTPASENKSPPVEILDAVDVVIVGSGISGICAACHLLLYCPSMSFVILEARSQWGGTWDFFKYPGIRSDSDMHTLGFSFHPWHSEKGLAAGSDIMAYLKETIDKFQLQKYIKLNHRVQSMNFCSKSCRWTLQIEKPGTGATGGTMEQVEAQLECQFMHMCTGYYQYDNGYLPDFDGLNTFNGKFVHPNKWDTAFDYAGKKVVVIGSGATAVTLVPELAKTAEHVVMLQRSPTYLASVPGKEPSIIYRNRFMPTSLSTKLTRWGYIGFSSLIWVLAKKFPGLVKKSLLSDVRKQLPQYSREEFAKHFVPHYDPWDERLCAVLDGNLFKALREGRASMVTDLIDHFTKTGIQLKNGQHVEADLVVSATGLNLQRNFPMSTIHVTIDGKPYKATETLMYRNLICQDVPNLIFTIGYAAASWTLGAEVTCRYWVRLLKHVRSNDYEFYCARATEDIEPSDEGAFPLSSGYIQRAKQYMPKTGTKAPWTGSNHFFVDAFHAATASLTDQFMEYRGPTNAGHSKL